MHVEVPPVILVELGLAIWIIYTWDHLNDAKVGVEIRSFRHQFHQRYQQLLLGGMVLALLVGAILVYFMPVRTIYLGVMLSVFVLIYFAIIQFNRRFYHKETLIAIVYTLGVFIGPYSCATDVPTMFLIACFFNVMVIAFINLMVFSEFEKAQDEMAGYPSLARALGGFATKLITWLLIGQLVILAVLYVGRVIDTDVAACFALMNLILCLVYFGKKFSERNEYYRVLGDGIFFIHMAFLL